jgi:CelD/BcsL family acetyltransferase involved in cellulose biosynthesis
MSVAKTLEQARDFFVELKILHQRHWQSKENPGAFGSLFANEFHETLIQTRFPYGEIQIAEFSAGPKRIGYLYNFVLEDVVTNYQTGLCYEDNPKLKPGLVAHSLAIDHNLRQGLGTYDLLMGKQRYKRNLATHTEDMVWLALQKRRLRFQVETWVKDVRKTFFS